MALFRGVFLRLMRIFMRKMSPKRGYNNIVLYHWICIRTKPATILANISTKNKTKLKTKTYEKISTLDAPWAILRNAVVLE